MTEEQGKKRLNFAYIINHNGYWIFNIFAGVLFLIVGFYQAESMNDINHRLDVKDAYFNKGLIEGAKTREEAFYKERERNQAILSYCKENDCNLPLSLRLEIEHKPFTPIESVLMNK